MGVMIILNLEEKEEIHHKQFAESSAFNCELDADGEWVVSVEELFALEGTEFAWLLSNEMKSHKARPLEDWRDPSKQNTI